MSELTFLARIEDPELRERIRTVMARFELLSDSDAAALEPSRGGKPESKAPAGAMKPRRDRGLFERYSHQFAKCVTRPDPQWAFRLLCAHAERDLDHYVNGPPESKQAGAINFLGTVQGRDGAAIEKEKGKEIVADYEGAPAGEVAAILQVTTGVVRKAREQNGRHAETGEPKAGWHGWTDEEKYAEVQKLKACGHGKAMVANRLRVTPRTVTKFWAERAARTLQRDAA